ncbi:MAG TPA: hypothetical protein ENK31_09640, partial [Nannocystis exedens]|nr:hypothetical protein [Nannocystis exedens]
MFEQILGEPAVAQLRAKAAMLNRLRRAGLPVPPGIVLPLAAATALPLSDALAGLLQSAPVIVRSALAIEDQTTTSGAGLGESVHDCTSLEAVRAALRRIAEARGELPMPVDASRPDQVIIQRQITASALLVVASAPDLATTVEVYTPGHGALAGNGSPHFAGPLARWPGAAREATARLVRRTSEHLMNPEMGLDLEIVIDDAARPWLVQARPLTRDLQPGFADFRRSVQADGHTLPSGWWRLDTAHNPAPLSPAHASLLSWLGRHRVGTPQALAGWLYESVDPIVPAHKATPQKNTLPPLGPDPFAAIDYLRAEALPRARDRLDAIIDRLHNADPQICRATIDRAREATLAMLDIYAALAPARAGPRTPPPTEGTPLCLVDRQRFLDVLPCAWDIAAPSLSEKLSECPGGPSAPPTPSTVNAAIWLLRELDDHLFALGLAPLRRVYLQAAQLLSLAEREVFLLSQEALAAALDRALTGSE